MYISLQLHITGRCNLSCKHCYIQEHTFEMSYSEIKCVLRQFDRLIRDMRKYYKEPIIPQLRITGGEPFLHKDIKKILLHIARKNYHVGIMSNGTLIDKKVIPLLSKIRKLQSFQVSLDGDKQAHDNLRGDGNFQKVLEVLDMLHLYGIKTRVSFTAHQDNYHLFPKVAEICKEHNVSSLWSDRYIPFGNDEIKPIDKKHMQDYNAVLLQTKMKYADLHVENYRALQFIGNNNTPYFCKAGEALITVDENGNIMPCRRLPVVCGNVRLTTLSDIYFNHKTFLQLREHSLDPQCTDCRYCHQCKGGARCMAYSIYCDYNRCDPSCFLNHS